MPDVHLGKRATIGSVVPNIGAIIPAAVGVDIGCGMMSIKTEIRAEQLPDNLFEVRHTIERAILHGRSKRYRKGRQDKDCWNEIPEDVAKGWKQLEARL